MGISLREFFLTRRQQQVVDLVAEGKTNKEIAERLGISPNTVKNHLATIYNDTGIHNRTELAVQDERTKQAEPEKPKKKFFSLR